MATHAVKHAFEAGAEGQLSVRKGERVVVVRSFDDGLGWTKVRIVGTSQPGGEGLVPEGYLVEL